MISRLEGILFEKRPTVIGVDVGGVGYEVNIPLSTFTALPERGDLVSLHIHTQVRDDAIQLYGFSSIAEVRAFQLLIRANRVGPRLAQTVLSGIGAKELLTRLADGDAQALSRVPGIGQKTANRLIAELRERAYELLGDQSRDDMSRSEGSEESPRTQLLSALTNLQVPKSQAKTLVDQVVSECGIDAPIEILVRTALQRLAR
mgnify:CR=1 FL=1